MPTCMHRVYCDPDRDRYEDGFSCGAPAIAYSIHPATQEKIYWCIRHAGERMDVQPIEVEDSYLDRQRKALERAQEALESAIDRDAPDETVRRLERVRDEAAKGLQMVGRAIR